MSNVPSLSTPTRLPWIDVAKGLGMLLVFYGHLVERYIATGVPPADDQMRWVYAFHMPLFFFLSGLVYKDRDLPAETFLKRQVLTRLVPAWLFNVVGMLIWLALPATLARAAREGWGALLADTGLRLGRETLLGQPEWNVLMWFLVALFVVELVQFALRRLLRHTALLVCSIALFAGLTWALTTYRELILERLAGGQLDWWHISSAVAGLVFYQVGILVRRLHLLGAATAAWRSALLAAAGLAVTLLTFQQNLPYLKLVGFPVVRLVNGYFGNVGWFFLTALAGIAFIAGLAQLLAGSGALQYIGRMTLALMCLDGILHQFVNTPLAQATTAWVFAPPAVGLAVICGLGTLFTLAGCLPVGWGLERLLPALFGRGRAPAPPPAAQPSEALVGAPGRTHP